MAIKNSLNHSMNSALKHYSSMFFLPSYKKALLAIAVICIAAVGFSTFALFPSVERLASSLVLGISLFALTLLADSVMSRIILKVDPIYLFRRTLALSFFCWILWLFFVAIGVVLGFMFGWLLWVKLCLLGYAAVVTMRAVVFIATSSAAMSRRLLSVLLQPTLCIVAFLVFWGSVSSALPLQVLPFIIISPIVGCASVFLFLSFLDRLGQKTYSMPSLPLFRAFMLNWVVGLNAPLEEFLERMGETADVEVTLLKFDSSKPKAAVIVPLVHPGPFKNIGSSLLPSLLKHGFEKEFGCDACVPLGILGHELDLASQAQNHKIVSQVIASAKFKASADLASPFVKVTEGAATASCQIFGDNALLSFTLAPKTTEDLPQELGRIVREEAEKHGLKCTMVVNAHNSINDIVDTDEYLGALQIAASKCLQKAVTLPTKQFMVGAATVFPKEFDLKDGMGTGGITAIVVQVEKQKTAYIIIDGNNMISGLREKILAALTSMGFDESEVFTTDTHAVSALVTGRRGYHPVGEVMNHDLLTRYIGEVAKKAEANLETSKAGCLRFVVPQVKVIGEARLHSISILVDKAIQKAKQTVFPIFGLEGLFLILLLTLF
jgi:putative membrane protein